MTGSSRPPLADLLAGGITVALGAFFLWGATLIEQREGVMGGPQVVPTAASICLLAAGIGILIAAVTPGHLSRTDRPTSLVFLIVGVGIAYVWAIDAVGYFPATLAVSPAAFAAFGGRGLRGTVVPGFLATVAIYVIFFRVLGVYDPPGQYFDFNAAIGG